MSHNVRHYTREQLTAAIEAADLDTALALWREKDWTTYSEMRNALLGAFRNRMISKLTLRHLQFIYFINMYLVPGCTDRMSGQQYFLKSN